MGCAWIPWVRWVAVLVTVSLATLLYAGPAAPARLVPAHVFMAELDDQLCPVVDVAGNDRIVVLKRDESRVTIPHKRLRLLKRNLTPVGRVTVCDTEGVSRSEGYISPDMITNFREVAFDFELVADRDLTDVYVVLFYNQPDSRGRQHVAFAKLKDMPAGDVVHRSAVFPGIRLPEKTRYHFELYSHGAPIQKLYLEREVLNPRSIGLLIPWKERLKAYRSMARDKKISRNPSAFKVTFRGMETQSYRDKGIHELRLKLRIRKDGTAGLVSGADVLTPADRELLLALVSDWRFFPEVKKGRIKEALISLPIKL